MRNTFRYTLNEMDYILFERMQFKRSVVPSTVFIAVFFVMIGVYDYISSKNIVMLICAAAAIAIAFLYFFIYDKALIKNKVRRYIYADSSYMGENEIIIDNHSIEIKNIPRENEAGIISIYPYKIMRAIMENNEYFFFYVGLEVKILPKKAIPQEMKEQVFSNIKKNQNYVYVK